MHERRRGGPTHATHPAEYRIWAGARYACCHPMHRNYHLYGARGVTVCDRWKKSFQAFMEDMGERPSAAAKLVRKNPAKGYCRDNCEWQAMDGKLHGAGPMVEVGGHWLPLARAARAAGLHPNTVQKRRKSGVPADKLLDPPKPVQTVRYKGRDVTLKQLAGITRHSFKTLDWRWRNGWRGEDLWKPARRRRRRP